MANGDLAALVGMDTVAGSADINQSFDEINKTRDYEADHRLNGTHPVGKITGPGSLPVVRGGTGRTKLYDTEHEGGPHPTSRRILIVDNENRVFASIGDISPLYLGYQMDFTTLLDVKFDDGQAVEPHGFAFTPTEIMVQGLLTAGGGLVVCTARADNEPANAENVFLRAHNVAGPYNSTLSKIVIIGLRKV